MEPCPHCGAMLAARLVAEIRNPFSPESCPLQPKVARRVDARLTRAGEIVPGERAAARLVAYALFGSVLEDVLVNLTGDTEATATQVTTRLNRS